MSQRAISMPVMAALPTTPVMPWPIMARKVFYQSVSMWKGSSPTRIGARSWMAVWTTLGQPLDSPTP